MIMDHSKNGRWIIPYKQFIRLRVNVYVLFCRYAFSPLIDAADDEEDEDESVLNDAFGRFLIRCILYC